MKCILSILFLFAFLPFLGAAELLLLKGTVGKSPVIIQLEIDGDDVYGNYFYLKTGVNIPFEGVTLDGKYSFHAGSRFIEREQQEHFQLQRKGNSFIGTWTFNGKKLNVKLAPTTKEATKHPYAVNPFLADAFYDEMDYIRTSTTAFERLDSVTVVNGVTFQWFRETHSNVVLFRVTKGMPMNTITFVNNYLEAIQIKAFAYYGSCGYGEADTEYHANVNSYFVNADFLSLSMIYDYYCGGAHPDFSTVYHNLDLKGLKPIDADELIQFSGVVVQNENNFSEWSTYRGSVFGPEINNYLRAAYPAYFQYASQEEAEAAEECNYNDPGIWEFSNVLITEEGLLFDAYFVRYQRSCDSPEWAVLPFKTLQAHLNPAYKAALLSIR